ncbi:transcription termination factor NusA [Chloroflexota bacterium]
MKSDFLLAITQLSAEKNLSKEVVLTAVEAALVSAYRKDNFALNQNIAVKINPNSGEVEVWAEKTIVDTPSDSRCEISLKEAAKIKPDAQIDDTLMVESTPHNAGRIAAQTAKQVILQRLHEAEHSAIFEEYVSKEGDVITGVVQRIEAGQIFVDIGRTEAILPVAEQMRNERYRPGQRLKVVIFQVVQTSKGARVVLSRSHPDLLRRLFEVEVPEVFNGVVELKSIAREAGYRSKVAVAARQEGIDPVGCCVGLRGIRIQNIVSELNGEKIDVVMWNPVVATFIANALSPAHILSVGLNQDDNIATVVVPDKQLSLAIGKEGQNARLAAKLTGWRIDIKSASAAEAEKPAIAEPPAEATDEITEVREAEIIIQEVPVEIPPLLEPIPVSAETPESKASETLAAPDEDLITPPISFESQVTEEKPQLRFAEDILAPRSAKPAAKSKKKKKKGAYGKEKSAEDGIRLRKAHREETITDEDEEYQ